MVDKECMRQILGTLMTHPHLLSEVDKYSLTLSDFPTKFERYIFYAISGLYEAGTRTIQVVDIDNYLKTNQAAKATFNNNNGIEYLQDALEFSNYEGFQYYYDKLKKMNLLSELGKKGFDTKEIYDEDLTSKDAFEINSRFEKLSNKDIIDHYKKNLLTLENKYATPEEIEVQYAADGIEDFIEDMEGLLSIGLPIQGEIYNQVMGGAQKGSLTIRSCSSGLGKTRGAIGDACMLAYPIRYNPDKCQWERVGSNERVLFIITEQSFKEAKLMILAYLTGIETSRFKYGSFSDEEKIRIEQGQNLMKKYSDNFIILRMPNPNVELLKSLIREQCILNQIDYVFFDYIFVNPGLLREFRGFNLRNDELLLLMATALKDLAVELNVGVFTSTQVNASADDNKNIRNEASLAGGRATINKADNGAIMARPTKEELEILDPIIQETGLPNVVTDIFKVRNGEWTQVRIWSILDLGIMRRKDLFITDSRLEPIPGFSLRNEFNIVNWEDDEDREIDDVLNNLRGGGVISGL